MYGHIQKLAEAEKKGIEAAGGEATIYQYDNPLIRYGFRLAY
jgi:NAD(P)H dehydrogenase (quinone)